jgi:hypothetical protein
MERMGAFTILARQTGTILALFLTALGLVLLTEKPAKSAIYEPHSWYLNGFFSYDVTVPKELNQRTEEIASIEGLIGGRLRIEKGLLAPNWTHWMEASYQFANVSAVSEMESGALGAFSRKLSFIGVIPLGVSWWFKRTDYIDFGASLGLGLGLRPSYQLTSALNSGPASTMEATGKTGFLASVRLEGRAWVGKYTAINLSGGLQQFGTTFTTNNGDQITTSFSSLSIMGGITFAFGGAKGVGRSYIEVIRAKPASKPDTKPAKPRGKPTS